jgi:hypothetical protein
MEAVNKVPAAVERWGRSELGLGNYVRGVRINLALSQRVAFLPLAVLLAAAGAKAALMVGFVAPGRTRA